MPLLIGMRHFLLAIAALAAMYFSHRHDWFPPEMFFVESYFTSCPLFLLLWKLFFNGSLGSHHPYTQQVRQNYIFLLRAMRRDAEAKQFEEKQ